MREIKDYKTQAEKEAIIAEMMDKGFVLVEEQSHFDGKHLIFERDLAAEMDDIKVKLKKKGIL